MNKAVPKPNICDVYDHYGLKVLGPDRGGWRKAECPLPDHEDRNPSASINEDNCRWHCHRCDRSGDALDILKEREGVTRFSSLVKLCEELFGGSDQQVRGERESSSLLPHRSGPRPGRRNWSPPWGRL